VSRCPGDGALFPTTRGPIASAPYPSRVAAGEIQTSGNGRQDQLEGKIQERYGLAKDQAKKDVEAWFNSLA
jgi:hypothetical protein